MLTYVVNAIRYYLEERRPWRSRPQLMADAYRLPVIRAQSPKAPKRFLNLTLVRSSRRRAA